MLLRERLWWSSRKQTRVMERELNSHSAAKHPRRRGMVMTRVCNQQVGST